MLALGQQQLHAGMCCHDSSIWGGIWTATVATSLPWALKTEKVGLRMMQ
jgi:hypothetical protein